MLQWLRHGPRQQAWLRQRQSGLLGAGASLPLWMGRREGRLHGHTAGCGNAKEEGSVSPVCPGGAALTNSDPRIELSCLYLFPPLMSRAGKVCPDITAASVQGRRRDTPSQGLLMPAPGCAGRGCDAHAETLPCTLFRAA